MSGMMPISVADFAMLIIANTFFVSLFWFWWCQRVTSHSNELFRFIEERRLATWRHFDERDRYYIQERDRDLYEAWGFLAATPGEEEYDDVK